MRIFLGTYLLVRILFVATDCFALDPDSLITQYSQRYWSTKDGLPMNGIEAVSQSGDGYIWIATQEGLVRFDGVRFTVFNRNNTQALSHNWINTLERDKQGNLWISTWGGGVVHYKNGVFQRLSSDKKLPSSYIDAILVDRSNNLWIGTAEGLVRISDSSTVVYQTEHGLNANTILSLAEDRSGRLWIGTLHGLNRMSHGRIENISEISSTEAILTLYHDKDDSVWAGMSSGVIAHFVKDQYFHYELDLPHNRIRKIFRDRLGNLWIGSDTGGLKRFKNGRFESLPFKERTGAYEVSAIFEDEEENLWLGTSAGLVQLSDGKILPYGVPEGLSEDYVWTVLGERIGKKLWIGTFNGGLNLLENTTIRIFSAPSQISSNAITALHQDRAGNLWIGTRGGGLNQYYAGKFRTFTSDDGLAGNWIQSIYEDRDRSLWIGTYGRGLSRLKEGRFVTYKKENGFPGNSVSSILQDQNGVLWTGGENGLIRWTNEKFQLFDSRNGLPSNDIIFLLEDDDGSLWIGTGAGLSLLKNGKFYAFTQKDGLAFDHILGIVEDNYDRLWFSSNLGIYSVSKKNLLGFALGNEKFIRCETYGEADGMRSAECNGGYQPSAWKTPDGRLWFATVRGLAMIDPNRLKKNMHKPLVHINILVANDTAFDIQNQKKGNPLTVGPGKNKVEFHYTALSYRNPERVQFRYMLEGFDPEWVNAGTRRVAYYTNLPPKHYRFRVIAANEDGIWNEKGSDLTFELLPFFYQTPWFYAACTLLLAALLYAAHQYKVGRVQKRLLMILNERYRIARELHDSVAQTMSTVVIQLEAADEIFRSTPDKAKGFLGSALKGARESVLHIRKSILDLRDDRFEEKDFSSFLKKEIIEISEETGIVAALRSEGSPIRITPEVQEQLAYITREAIWNAAKHARPDRIDINLQYSKNSLQLCVRDDGSGFDPDIPTSEGHFGLQGMRERAEKIGAQIFIKSQPARGTEITLELPICNRRDAK